MSASSNLRHRGFTIAEMLTVMVILGIFTTFVVAIVAPVVSAPSKEQAKIDTLQAAVQGLYEVQRDLRMSDSTGVYSCVNGGTITCAQPSSAQGTSILAVVSPLAAGQLTWDLTAGPTLGLPAWQGVIVYWMTPNNSGSNDLEKAYVGSSALGSLGSGPLPASFSSTAAKAVQKAQAAGGTTIAHNVSTMSASIHTTTHIIGLNLTAQSTENHAVNSTAYTSDTYARN